MPDTSQLAYDTAAAAAIWQRVSPAMPAYDEARPRSDDGGSLRSGEEAQTLRRLIDDTAAVCRGCRRGGWCASGQAARTLTALARETQAALRSLLAAHFLLTGRWYQPALPPDGAESPLELLRTLYRMELATARRCETMAGETADACLRGTLASLAESGVRRAQRLAALLEKTLTNRCDLLKW